MYNRLCVVIPVHKNALTVNEIISLKQCYKVLKNYSVYLVFPAGLNIEKYKQIFPSLILLPVEKSWLNSIEAYNKMKCSIKFYTLFQKHDYMLTYELDSYIFSNDWDSAKVFDYDYIGAPWFESYSDAKSTSLIIGVGNSGFSIRNIKKCLAILQLKAKTKKLWNLFSKFQLHRLIRLTILLKVFNPLWNVKGKNVNFFTLMTEDHINEDVFWANASSELFHFRKSPIKNAFKFSFEVNPDILYQLNNQQLPIGCHAWEKYNPDFWKNFIDVTNE